MIKSHEEQITNNYTVDVFTLEEAMVSNIK